MRDKFIIPEKCAGDILHNKYVDILLEDITFDKFQTEFLRLFFHPGTYKTGDWLFNSWTKKELQKINTILKYHKHVRTIPQKISRLKEEFTRGSWACQLLNKSKLRIIEYLLDCLEEGKLTKE